MLLSILTLSIVALRILEGYLLFKPKIYPLGNWHPVGPKPINVWVKSVDGIKVHGWYLPYKNPKAVILYLHGNQGNVTDYYTELVKLHDDLYASVLILDYRGFGKSAGSPEEKLLISDAEVARAWLARKEGISPNKEILIGHSLGGGIAVDLASRLGARALILISTFLSIPEVVRDHYGIPFTSMLMHNQMQNVLKIVNYKGPLLIIHSDADELIPLEHSKKLFALAPSIEKIFFQIHGSKHFSPLSQQVYQEIKNFVTLTASLRSQ